MTSAPISRPLTGYQIKFVPRRHSLKSTRPNCDSARRVVEAGIGSEHVLAQVGRPVVAEAAGDRPAACRLEMSPVTGLMTASARMAVRTPVDEGVGRTARDVAERAIRVGRRDPGGVALGRASAGSRRPGPRRRSRTRYPGRSGRLRRTGEDQVVAADLVKRAGELSRAPGAVVLELPTTSGTRWPP